MVQTFLLFDAIKDCEIDRRRWHRYNSTLLPALLPGIPHPAGYNNYGKKTFFSLYTVGILALIYDDKLSVTVLSVCYGLQLQKLLTCRLQ